MTLFQPGYLPAQTLSGNAFYASTAVAGVTLPILTATAQVCGLWNPLGSGVELLPISLDLVATAAATPVIAGLGLCWLGNTGSQVATGGPISAFTTGTIYNARLGLGVSSRAKFAPLTATIAAPVVLGYLGKFITSTTAGTDVQDGHYEFNGKLSIPPGNYVGLGSTIAQSGTTFAATWTWIELPFSG